MPLLRLENKPTCQNRIFERSRETSQQEDPNEHGGSICTQQEDPNEHGGSICTQQEDPNEHGGSICTQQEDPNEHGGSICTQQEDPNEHGGSICTQQEDPNEHGGSICTQQEDPNEHGGSICTQQEDPNEHGGSICTQQEDLNEHGGSICTQQEDLNEHGGSICTQQEDPNGDALRGICAYHSLLGQILLQLLLDKTKSTYLWWHFCRNLEFVVSFSINKFCQQTANPLRNPFSKTLFYNNTLQQAYIHVFTFATQVEGNYFDPATHLFNSLGIIDLGSLAT